MAIFPALIPEVTFALRGAPPEILTAVGLVPAPPAEFAAEFPVLLGCASAVPPGTPGFFPSGEIVTRAARFPAGGATADGPGVAESAISVCAEPFGEVSCAATSGAGSVAPSCFLCETRGATPALICNFGRSGAGLVIARFKSSVL